MTRDRDVTGRARNARTRDELGRPLAERDAIAPTDEPPLAPAKALAAAQQLLDNGRPFEAHEVLEAVWKNTSGDERALWQGLAQLAVGITHRMRGNEAGAQSLLRRSAETLAPYDGKMPYDVPISDLRSWAVAASDDPPRAGAAPRLSGNGS